MLPKQNILNFTMTVFVKILGVQEAWSLGVIWFNTVVFLWILVLKYGKCTFYEYFQQQKYTADFLYDVDILINKYHIDNVSQQ